MSLILRFLLQAQKQRRQLEGVFANVVTLLLLRRDVNISWYCFCCDDDIACGRISCKNTHQWLTASRRRNTYIYSV